MNRLDPVRAPAAPSPGDLLREVFGFDAFRGRQREIIEAVASGENALVLMPTGGGKSLCYQIPALMRPGTAVVVSPLIALMRDQVEALKHNGVRAAVLNSSLDAPARRQVEEELLSGDLDLLYMAPEGLLQSRNLDLLARCRVALFAIDEAHCVSQWGHDFRPEYLKLACLAQRFPAVPRIALTATADTRTRDEIAQRLFADGCRTFVASFDRPNIRYRVGIKRNARDQLLSFIRTGHAGHSGIVYCLTRKKSDEIAAWLCRQDVDAVAYHAGMDAADREAAQDRFIRDDGVVVVATVAFGMGIDKPDVRFVAHLDLPKSIESYYQETGRAGRDGAPADAWLVYGLADVYRLRQLLAGSDLPDSKLREERARLEALLAYCEESRCRRPVLLGYFGENHAGDCGHCDNCLEPPQTWDATEPARKALSCVYRTGQRFGAGHLVDVLTGKINERIEKLGHDRLSTFGIGTDLDKAVWHSVLRQLLARGYLAADPDGHGGLRLADGCRPLLRGEESLQLRRDVVAKPARRRSSAPEAPEVSDPEGFESLRQLRLEIAREEGVPPYVIFHDRTLAAMLEARPETLEAMAEVPGIGRHKLEKYGQTFLDALTSLPES